MKFNGFKRLLIMCFVILSLSFLGCASGFRSTTPEGDISSVLVVQNHMNRSQCYSFSAYKQDENYYMNSWCFFDSDDDIREVNIENILITKEEFEKFSEFDEKYDFFSLKAKEKKGNRLFQPSDKTKTTFTVSYDGEKVNLKTDNECYEAVYDYFITLTEKYRS